MFTTCLKPSQEQVQYIMMDIHIVVAMNTFMLELIFPLLLYFGGSKVNKEISTLSLSILCATPLIQY